MKRIILLFLALSCFRFTYAEELTSEQQKLAWKFIYDNVLSNEEFPNIFSENIKVNLKGEFTTVDSVVVKELIKSFQKAIPHLKIELSDMPGNLILGLNDGKHNKVTTNLHNNQSTTTMEMIFPNDLTDKQKKQFIYFHLFKGLTFYNWPKVPINGLVPSTGLSGCVFAENDFKSVTFSPFDWFILEKLYAADFSVQLSQNLPQEVQNTAWNFIRNKFLFGGSADPVIYKTAIGIKLDGDVSPIDSICIDELINSLKSIIPNRKIFLAKENANLIITFSDTLRRIMSFNVKGSEIRGTQFEVNYSKDNSKDERKKVLYYALCNSLIRYQGITQDYRGNITGSAFDELNPKDVNYHPIDVFILNKLYADDFLQQFRDDFIARFSYRTYLATRYSSKLDLLFSTIALLVSLSLLFYLLITGVFSRPSLSAKEYFKQGSYLILLVVAFGFIGSWSDLVFTANELKSMLQFILRGFLLIGLIFIFEKVLLKKVIKGSTRIVQIFLVTFICMLIVTIPYSPNALRNSSYLVSFALSFLRATYIFIIDWHFNILTKKDLELAKMSELHKQAELQSLRAKINPHFLYNALNSIASLASTNAGKAEEMALALSDFFKYSINREQKQMNSLSEELNAIRIYLEIEKVRFGERLTFSINCPPELADVQVPQLLIQPLVENAVKHGLSQITENGQIKIEVLKENGLLKIRVADNGPAFPDDLLGGFGIRNTQERLSLCYGNQAFLRWVNTPEKLIELVIPA